MEKPRIKDLPRWLTSVDPAIVAIVFIGLGFAAIAIAWNGAAGKAFVDQMVPYILSGGILGLGLIGVGAGLFLFEAGRRNQAHLEHKLDELIEVMRGSTNGSTPGAVAPARAVDVPKIAPSPGMVVVGRSSYHRTDCRLVEGKDDLDYATLEEAQGSGLTPCRVCEPNAVSEPATTARRRRR